MPVLDINGPSLDSTASGSTPSVDITYDELWEILNSEHNSLGCGEFYTSEGHRIWEWELFMQGDCERKSQVPFAGPSGFSGSQTCPSGIERVVGMEVEAKIEEGKVESPLQLEKATDVIEVKVESQFQLEDTTDRMEVEEDLEDIFGALRDAQSELKRIEKKWHRKETALRDEVCSLRAKHHDDRRELEDTRFALHDYATKVASLETERAAAIVASENERRKLTFMREDAHQKMKASAQAFDAIVTTMLIQQRNLEVEGKVLKRAANAQRILKNFELKKHQSELDALRTSTQVEKQRHELENRRAEEQLQVLEHRLDFIEQGRDAALFELDEQKAKVEDECNAKLRISKLLTVSQCKRRRLEYDLIVAGEEVAEEKMTMEEAHRTEMAKARADCRNLEVKLLDAENKEAKLEEELLHTRDKCKELETTRKTVQENFEAKLLEAESKEAKLVEELLHSRDKCKELETTQKTLQHNLEEEKEKSSCQICFESPKDCVAFPCLHFNYCFSCLESHRTRNQSCPTCRTTIVAVLKCVVCV